MQQTTQTDQKTHQDLADRARQQIVEVYGPSAADTFHHAERLVNAGRVQLTARNAGLVYAEPGGWRNVYPGYCSHCLLTDPTLVCVHKLAVAYADLLHRHRVLNGEHAPAPVISRSASDEATPNHAATTLPGLRSHSGHVTWHRRRTRRPDHKHCPRCGGWLTAQGSCNRCGGAR